MASLDLDYKGAKRHLRCHLGALLLTTGMFAAIASTGIGANPRSLEEDKPTPLYYIPPPEEPDQEEATTPKSARSLEPVAIDTAYEEEPVDIALDRIDVSLDPDVTASLSLSSEIEATFQASRPEAEDLEPFVIYERSEVDHRPRPTYTPEPNVPYRLRGERVELVVFYYIDSEGRPSRVSVLDANTENPQYAELAKDAIQRWRFRPARRNGKSVACWVQQDFRFMRGSTSPFSLY